MVEPYDVYDGEYDEYDEDGDMLPRSDSRSGWKKLLFSIALLALAVLIFA